MANNTMIIDVEDGDKLIIETIDKYNNRSEELFIQASSDDKSISYVVTITVEVSLPE